MRHMMLLGERRSRKYWETTHPGEGSLLAGIATDHDDWSDEQVVNWLRFEQLGPDAR